MAQLGKSFRNGRMAVAVQALSEFRCDLGEDDRSSPSSGADSCRRYANEQSACVSDIGHSSSDSSDAYAGLLSRRCHRLD